MYFKQCNEFTIKFKLIEMMALKTVINFISNPLGCLQSLAEQTEFWGFPTSYVKSTNLFSIACTNNSEADVQYVLVHTT